MCSRSASVNVPLSRIVLRAPGQLADDGKWHSDEQKSRRDRFSAEQSGKTGPERMAGRNSAAACHEGRVPNRDRVKINNETISLLFRSTIIARIHRRYYFASVIRSVKSKRHHLRIVRTEPLFLTQGLRNASISRILISRTLSGKCLVKFYSSESPIFQQFQRPTVFTVNSSVSCDRNIPTLYTSNQCSSI